MMAVRGMKKKVLDGIFESGDVDATLEAVGVSSDRFNMWVDDEEFMAEFQRRVARGLIRSQAIVSAFQPVAARKLASLVADDKGETARKACLDILGMGKLTTVEGKGPVIRAISEGLECSKEQGAKIMAILAEDGSE